MSEQLLNQMLDHIIEMKEDVGQIKTAVSNSKEQLKKHEKEINHLKKFKWIATGVVTAVSTTIAMFWQVTKEWLAHGH